jgi:hypothetical protein|tara:strand:+ start:538 stop:762 length:225 start_codon:yes stop_codon:yes gene_type:complete
MDLYKRLRLIKNKVMGLLDKQKSKQKKDTSNQLMQLSSDEIKYLITLIGKSEFKGTDLQLVYSITAKLQNQLKK